MPTNGGFPRRALLRVALSVAASATALGAVAQTAPTAPTPPRTVRMIVGYPAGGVSDTIARALADRREQLARLSGQVAAGRSRAAAGEAEIERLAAAAPDEDRTDR